MSTSAHTLTFIEDLLRKMTLAEKVSMLAGTNEWFTVPVERLGIPSLKMSDGPNGARGEGGLNALKTACFPVEVLLASSWDTALVERIGQALADEARMKGAQVLLGPTVNIQRSPLAGRGFESFSEDPYLTARLAVAYIKGVQSQGIGTSIKHLACNDQEFERFTISAEVRERALREIHLPAFEAGVREAEPWTVMAAYNLVNGVPASEHQYLLTQILREEWGFEGVVISDWYGSVKSTAPSINAGLDLEMPVPRWRGQKLIEAVERGEVKEATIDASVRRLLQLLQKAGRFEHPQIEPEQSVDLPERRALIREAAAEGIILLKNEAQTLPLAAQQLKRIAVIGPAAKTALIFGGGSSQVNAHYAVSPFEGIVSKMGGAERVGYEQGCTNNRFLPLLEGDKLLAGAEGTQHGLAVEFFNSGDLSGAPVGREIQPQTVIQWMGAPVQGADPLHYSARLTARYTPAESGVYTFGLLSEGLSRLSLDGRALIDNWTHQIHGGGFYGYGSTEVRAEVSLKGGQEYLLSIDFGRQQGASVMGALRLGVASPAPTDMIERAVKLATDADAAILCMGFGGEWQSEGVDRSDLALPEPQNALIAQVAAVNPRTIVVLNTGSPITMPWLQQVAAVVQAWYPGQECGNAIADVLFGDVNPSGKLPQTFPMRVEENPTYLNFPGENGKVYYGEGLFVGYRYYDKTGIAPLFPFGFGLSYTTFAYGPLKLSAQQISPEETLQASVEITNAGGRAGKEVVQLYVRDKQARLQRPDKELKAFAKVHLEPGEKKTVTLSLDRSALSYYDDKARQWVAEPGEFNVLVGASSQDIRATATFTLTR